MIVLAVAVRLSVACRPSVVVARSTSHANTTAPAPAHAPARPSSISAAFARARAHSGESVCTRVLNLSTLRL